MIAIIFHRFGPYHWARLQATCKVLPILAIELSSETEEYLWDKVGGASGFKRVTLFPEGDSRKATTKELSRRLEDCLDANCVKMVAIPGWGDKGALVALRWCSVNHVPAVVMSDSISGDTLRAYWKEAIKRRVVTLCSSALVAGTQHAEYLKTLGLLSDRIFLGYDAVDNRHFADKVAEVRSQKSEITIKCGLSGKFFLVPARFILEKNLPRLIEAYARYRTLCETTSREPRAGSQQSEFQVSDLRPPTSDLWSLVLLGDGELRPAICSQIQALGLQDHVLLPGFKQYPELPTYYGMASAMILPSISETWGLVVNEAMASGLPVLVSNRCGCAQDLVQEGVNGFTFDPYNVEQMAQQMVRVWSMEPGARSKMGDASRQIISVWGPERFAAGLEAAAECAIAVGPKRPSLMQRMILKALLAR